MLYFFSFLFYAKIIYCSLIANQVYKSGIALAQREVQIVMLPTKLKCISFNLQINWGIMAGDNLISLSPYNQTHNYLHNFNSWCLVRTLVAIIECPN